MKLRSVFGIMVAGACLALLAMSASVKGEASRSLRVGIIIIAVTIYLVTMWVRNRLSQKKGKFESSQSTPNQLPYKKFGTTRKYFNAWNLVVASIALIGLSLMIVMRFGGTETHASRLVYWVSAWGILVVTAALVIASPPHSIADRFANWWLPGILLLLIAYVTISRVPDLVKAIAGRQDADQPNSVTLLLAPIAVFVWRSIRILRSTSIKR